MERNTCLKCRWFEMIEHEYGECRIRAPVIIEKLVGGSSYSSLFQATKSPLVSSSHWCGEFTVRDDESMESDEP